MMRISTCLLVSIALAMLIGMAVASEPYFPELVFSQRKAANDSRVEWYSEHLRAMGEPSMWKLSRDDLGSTGYRFLWLPTEGHPVAVRIVKAREGAVLKLVQLNGAGGFSPGKVAINKEVALSNQQWEGLTAFVSRARFWEMPIVDKRIGRDGEQLIVEGVKGGKYHVVDRWSPESGDFRKLCRHMVDLAGLDVGPSWYETTHVTPSLGKFTVITSEKVAIALRFVRHTGKGDGGSVYEWAMQEDGSADFTRTNVKTGRGEVYENSRGTLPGDHRGQAEIRCGPLVVRWSPASEDANHLYFPSRPPDAISMAATEWADLRAIDLDSPRLTWYHSAETR